MLRRQLSKLKKIHRFFPCTSSRVHARVAHRISGEEDAVLGAVLFVVSGAVIGIVVAHHEAGVIASFPLEEGV